MPIALSADGSVIAAGGADKKLHFFNGSFTPAWSYDAGGAEGSVWSLALSDDGKKLFASTGLDNAVMFADSAKSTPTWSYDGNYASPHVSGIGLVDPYQGGSSAEGDSRDRRLRGAVALSADRQVPSQAPGTAATCSACTRRRTDLPCVSHHERHGLHQRRRHLRGRIWIVAGTTFGEVLAWEVAPAVMIEVGTPVTVNIPSNPDAGASLGLGDVKLIAPWSNPAAPQT